MVVGESDDNDDEGPTFLHEEIDEPSAQASEEFDQAVGDGDEDDELTPDPEPEPHLPVVVTDLNPDSWPSTDAGTVTDENALRRNGLAVPEPQVATGSAPEEESAKPIVGDQSADTYWQCLRNSLPSTCAIFRSDAHLRGLKVQCPTCESTTVQVVEKPAVVV